jgi:hypothetical protein
MDVLRCFGLLAVGAERKIRGKGLTSCVSDCFRVYG